MVVDVEVLVVVVVDVDVVVVVVVVVVVIAVDTEVVVLMRALKVFSKTLLSIVLFLHLSFSCEVQGLVLFLICCCRRTHGGPWPMLSTPTSGATTRSAFIQINQEYKFDISENSSHVYFLKVMSYLYIKLYFAYTFFLSLLKLQKSSCRCGGRIKKLYVICIYLKSRHKLVKVCYNESR